MTCETATLLMHFARPGELAPDDRTALDAHVAGCTACSALAGRNTARDAAIATAMKAVTIPIGFRDALQSQAIAAQTALWRTTWLRRASTGLAAAVVLLLGYGLAANLSRPTLNSDALLADFDLRGTSPLNYDDWRQAEGVPPLPEDFDLRALTYTGRQPLAGRLVPAIRLQPGNGHDAVVFFVRESQFRLASVTDAVGSNGSVRVYRDQPGGWTVIVVHTGNSLAPFLHRAGSSV